MSFNGKFIKLPSSESGPYTTHNNRVNFDIAVGNYDLSRSYFAIYGRVSTTDNAGGATDGIYNVQPRWTNSIGEHTEGSITINHHPELENVAMVRNASLASTTKGRIEDIRRVDILKQNLAKYTKSTSELRDSRNIGLSNAGDRYELRRNPFTTLRREGTTISSYDRVPLLIPFTDVFGALDKWSEGLGDLKARLELNVDNIEVAPEVPAISPDIYETIRAMDDLAVAPDAYNVLEMKYELEEKEQMPYHVGQLVTVSYTQNATPQTLDTQIVGIDYDYSVGLVASITISDSIDCSTHEATGLVVEPKDAHSAEFSIEYCEVVLFQSDSIYDMPANAMFRTWTTEEFNGNAVKTLQRQYEVEPNAINLLVMNVKGDLVASNNQLERFRLRVNGDDVNDRDVLMGNYTIGTNHFKNSSGLYYDNLNKTFINMGMPLRNLNELNYSINHTRSYLQHTHNDSKLSIIATPLHLTQSQKLVQLNLESTVADISHVVLFKNVVRQLN